VVKHVLCKIIKSYVFHSKINRKIFLYKINTILKHNSNHLILKETRHGVVPLQQSLRLLVSFPSLPKRGASLRYFVDFGAWLIAEIHATRLSNGLDRAKVGWPEL